MPRSSKSKLKGIVEVDDTYIGGKQRGHRSKLKNKDVVIGVRERGGQVRYIHTPDNKADTIYQVIADNVAKGAEAIMTDENPGYNFKLTQFKDVRHGRIRHKDKIYVSGNVHTNTVESALSLFKRGIVGAFHKVSLKHLQRYLEEFSFRFNNRKSPESVRHDGDADGQSRRNAVQCASSGERVHTVYQAQIAKPDSWSGFLAGRLYICHCEVSFSIWQRQTQKVNALYGRGVRLPLCGACSTSPQ